MKILNTKTVFKIIEKICVIAASGFGVGYLLPTGQGTLAAFFALFLIPFFGWLSFFQQLLFILGIVVVGILVSFVAEKKLGNKDDHRIVIDEIVSVFITFLGVGPQGSWFLFGTGFIVNRLLDIFKPFGINKLQYFRGGWGIMLDDIVSALLSNFILRLIF